MITLFRNMRMFNKLLVSPMIIIIFLIGIVLLSYFGFSKQNDSMDDIYNVRFKNHQDSAGVIMALTSVHASVYKIIGWVNANYDAGRVDEAARNQWEILAKNIEFMKNTSASKKINEEERKHYKKALEEAIKYNDMVHQSVDMAKADPATASILMGQAEENFQILNRSLQDLIAIENKLGKTRFEAAAAGSQTIVLIFIVVSAVAILISIFLNIFTARLITTPLKDAIQTVGRIAEGDLTQEVAAVSKDEIGELVRSVDTMRKKMGEVVGRSVATSQVLSSGSSEQASSLEETSSSLEEMSSMIRRNADNTSHVNQLMNEAKRVTEKASGSMGDLTNSMKEITAASEQTQKIVKTIDEIAFQTNLLALNAAVEAARAGEAGAGFAVVAEEVRNLAMRAAEAARSSSGMMEDIVRKIKNGEQLVGITSAAVKQIDESSRKVVDLMEEIAAASKEQSEGIGQVNQAVAQINQITQGNASHAEELAAMMTIFKTEQREGTTLPEKHSLPERRSVPEIPFD